MSGCAHLAEQQSTKTGVYSYEMPLSKFRQVKILKDGRK